MSTFPFAGIVDRKELPDGPESWDDCSLELIGFNELFLTQDCLVIAQLFPSEIKPADYCQVVMWKHKLYLYNGHHRVVKAAFLGHICMWMRRYIVRD